MTQASEPRLPKLPFVFADIVLLGLACLILWRSQAPMTTWTVFFCTASVALGAVLCDGLGQKVGDRLRADSGNGLADDGRGLHSYRSSSAALTGNCGGKPLSKRLSGEWLERCSSRTAQWAA